MHKTCKQIFKDHNTHQANFNDFFAFSENYILLPFAFLTFLTFTFWFH